VAVVTGASSGIGEATARRFSSEGASVALLARRAERVEALAEELGRDGGSAIALEADVRDADGMAETASRIADRLGRVDCLVNNAGVMLLSEFADRKADEWRAMIETNLLGVFQTTDAFLDQLTDGGGDIVNISSVAGRQTRATLSVYSATKWGINGWSEALRQELLDAGVRVIVIEPGAVRTELADHISDRSIQEGIQQRYEEFDAMEAGDIAEAIAFAVSRPARVSLNEILIRPTKQRN
jgi:NADP-dependent 3-hydroxy acid dehydrogenase YdfG